MKHNMSAKALSQFLRIASFHMSCSFSASLGSRTVDTIIKTVLVCKLVPGVDGKTSYQQKQKLYNMHPQPPTTGTMRHVLSQRNETRTLPALDDVRDSRTKTHIRSSLTLRSSPESRRSCMQIATNDKRLKADTIIYRVMLASNHDAINGNESRKAPISDYTT